MNSNSTLKKIYSEDQEERKLINWNDKLAVRNLSSKHSRRIKDVKNLLRNLKLRTSEDFYWAAMIFHHGKTLENYARAVALSRISAELGSKDGKWLYARAIDRFLLKLGLNQKFGTQFSKVKGKWVLDPFDSKTKDKEREEYDRRDREVGEEEEEMREEHA